MDTDRVWTHVSDDQAAGRACVMCGRPTGVPGWQGVVVGRAADGAPVYACSGGTGTVAGSSPWSVPRPAGAGGRICAEQASTVVPDTLEELEP